MQLSGLQREICMSKCMYVILKFKSVNITHTRVHTRAHTHICTHMHTHMHARTHTHTHTHMHTHVHFYSLHSHFGMSYFHNAPSSAVTLHTLVLFPIRL